VLVAKAQLDGDHLLWDNSISHSARFPRVIG
jgi:hypothetical protein